MNEPQTDGIMCAKASSITSNPVLQRLEAWIQREKGRRPRCPQLKQYPHPGYAADYHENCESCLIVAAALELRKGPSPSDREQLRTALRDIADAVSMCNKLVDSTAHAVNAWPPENE